MKQMNQPISTLRQLLQSTMLGVILLSIVTACSNDENLEETTITPATLQVSAEIEGGTRTSEKLDFEAGDSIKVYLTTDTNKSTPYKFKYTEEGTWVAYGTKLSLTFDEVQVYACYNEGITPIENIGESKIFGAENLVSESVTVSLLSPQADFKFKRTQYMIKFRLISLGKSLTGGTFQFATSGTNYSSEAERTIDATATESFFCTGALTLTASVKVTLGENSYELTNAAKIQTTGDTGVCYTYNIGIPAFLEANEADTEKDILLSNGQYARIYSELGAYDTKRVSLLKTYLENNKAGITAVSEIPFE